MIQVHYGVCAVKIGKYWAGLTALGYCDKYRRTADQAIKDAERKEKAAVPRRLNQ